MDSSGAIFTGCLTQTPGLYPPAFSFIRHTAALPCFAHPLPRLETFWYPFPNPSSFILPQAYLPKAFLLRSQAAGLNLPHDFEGSSRIAAGLECSRGAFERKPRHVDFTATALIAQLVRAYG